MYYTSDVTLDTDSEIKLVLSLTGLDASQQHFKSLKPILLHRSVSSSDTSKYRCNCDSVSSEFSDLNVSASLLSHFLFFLSCSLSSCIYALSGWHDNIFCLEAKKDRSKLIIAVKLVVIFSQRSFYHLF